MRGHLIAVDTDKGIQEGSMSDDAIFELLTGPDATEIDKSWEAVFPLIGAIAGTGTMLVEDALPVGDDLGFGPAMFIDAQQVAAIHGHLSAVDGPALDEHWEQLDSPFMIGGAYDGHEGKDYAMSGYRRTAQLFAVAAAASQGVLFAIL